MQSINTVDLTLILPRNFDFLMSDFEFHPVYESGFTLEGKSK